MVDGEPAYISILLDPDIIADNFPPYIETFVIVFAGFKKSPPSTLTPPINVAVVPANSNDPVCTVVKPVCVGFVENFHFPIPCFNSAVVPPTVSDIVFNVLSPVLFPFNNIVLLATPVLDVTAVYVTTPVPDASSDEFAPTKFVGLVVVTVADPAYFNVPLTTVEVPAPMEEFEDAFANVSAVTVPSLIVRIPENELEELKINSPKPIFVNGTVDPAITPSNAREPLSTLKIGVVAIVKPAVFVNFASPPRCLKTPKLPEPTPVKEIAVVDLEILILPDVSSEAPFETVTDPAAAPSAFEFLAPRIPAETLVAPV